METRVTLNFWYHKKTQFSCYQVLGLSSLGESQTEGKACGLMDGSVPGKAVGSVAEDFGGSRLSLSTAGWAFISYAGQDLLWVKFNLHFWPWDMHSLSSFASVFLGLPQGFLEKWKCPYIQHCREHFACGTGDLFSWPCAKSVLWF